VHGNADPPVPGAGDRECGGVPAGGRHRGVVRPEDEEAAEEGPGGAGGQQCRGRGGGCGDLFLVSVIYSKSQTIGNGQHGKSSR